MMILFPCDPLSPRRVEMDFAPECDAAQAAGFETALIDFDALTREENLNRALRFIPPAGEAQKALYRGWMLKVADYALLHAALGERGIELINTPGNYQLCHEIPGWLPFFQDFTPETRCLSQDAISDEALRALLRGFGGGPLIVKDFVKSRKHEWREACFIPDAAHQDDALRVIRRFIELQGAELTGSVVLRRFVPLENIGEHPRSKMPQSREWRVFIANGQPLLQTPYWGQKEAQPPDLTPFFEAMSKIPSRFWTMDIARTQSGQWIVLELGDGQVSGLAEGTDSATFYQQLKVLAA